MFPTNCSHHSFFNLISPSLQSENATVKHVSKKKRAFAYFMRVKNKLAIFSALRTNQCEICNKTECFINVSSDPEYFTPSVVKIPTSKFLITVNASLKVLHFLKNDALQISTMTHEEKSSGSFYVQCLL